MLSTKVADLTSFCPTICKGNVTQNTDIEL